MDGSLYLLTYNTFNPIPARLCHVIYCQGDKSYPCLVGIGLRLKELMLQEFSQWIPESARVPLSIGIISENDKISHLRGRILIS
jgi:hypothetical protein